MKRGSIIAILSVAAGCSSSPPTSTPPAPTAAPPTAGALPDTPAGRQCRAWLDAFNDGDPERFRAFLVERFPSHVKMLEPQLELRDITGGFRLVKVESSTPTKLVALVGERDSDQLAWLTIEVGAAPPHTITSLEIFKAPRPPDLALPHLAEKELVASLRAKLDAAVAADRFAGAVLFAREGRVVFSGAYGLADRERKIANTLQTRFRIGSMNKMFTAVAVLQLAQAGKLALDDPIGKHLPGYPNKDVAARVTIEHLLTHTGGTGDIFGPEFDAHRLELKTIADYIKLYGKRDLAFAPGARFEYSNYGFILLGAVVEAISGQSYYDYVREHVYEPAGMTATGSKPENQEVAGRSVGYTRLAGSPWRPNTDTLPYRGMSAGGGYSTVEDLLRFATALQGHRLLDAEHTKLLTTGKVEVGPSRYAYGFFDETINGVRCFGHGGGAPGMNGQLEICPDAGAVIAVLANLDPMAAERIAMFIANRLPRQR